MSVTAQLGFDPTDANTINASHSVGAFVRAGTDGDLIGSETLNSLEWLRVAGPIIDSSGNEVGVTSNALDVNIAAASGLGIFAEDAAHTTGDDGQHILAVRNDTPSALTSADGDYGSLSLDASNRLWVSDDQAQALLTTIDADTGSIATDATAIAADTAALVVDLAAIEVDIAAIEVEQLAQGVTLDSILADTTSIDGTLTALSKSEDAAHSSGDQGIMGLAVANHTEGALHSADGDYAALQVDSSGRLRVVAQMDVDDDLADIAINNTATAVSTTAVNVVSSALANRKWLYLANEGNIKLYFGENGVTTSNGFPMSKGEKFEFRIGPSVAPQIIGGTGASSEDLRVMELS